MATFNGPPGLLVRLRVPIGNIRHIRFDDNGEYKTDNPRLIAKLSHKFDASNQPKVTENEFKCKKCSFETDNRGLLMAHYRAEHPKGAGK